MHRTAARSLVLGALALVVGRTAAGQLPEMTAATTRTPGTGPVSLNILGSVPKSTLADRERLAATTRRADALALDGKLVEAGRLYWSVVSEQRAVEDYPVATLRRLVVMYFSAGNEYAAASVLTELADAATQFGDPLTRLQSLFEASLLYREVGRDDRVLDCLRQIRPLLQSAAIPVAARVEISNRILVR